MAHARTLIVMLALMSVGAAHAQQPARIAIAVGHSGDDSVGQRLVFELRERIRASTGYLLVDNVKPSRVYVAVVTLDASCGETKNNMSAVAVTALHRTSDPEMLGSWVRLVGANRTREVAESILASIDKQLSNPQH